MVQRPERPRSEIRIGAMDAAYAAPLTRGLGRLEDVSFEVLPVRRLATEYLAGKYACALLPPLEALQYLPARLIPGIGIVRHASGCEGIRDGSNHLGVAEDPLALVSRLLHAERLGGRTWGPEAGESEATMDVFGQWQALTGLPLVLGVWATGVCAPVARLRAVLARAAQDGEVEHYQGLEYRLGGDAVESLRVMLRLAVKHGICPAETVLRLC